MWTIYLINIFTILWSATIIISMMILHCRCFKLCRVLDWISIYSYTFLAFLSKQLNCLSSYLIIKHWV
jgi:hypothetical protein